MGDFIGLLIEFVASIWHTDSQMRDGTPMTSGSQFDRESRRFVARLCGGIIVLLMIAGFLWCQFGVPQQPNKQQLLFNICSQDVVSASTESLDKSRLSTNSPDFNAQLHLKLTDKAAKAFEKFNQKHDGQNYELQINGQTLLPAVFANAGGGGREVCWYVSSLSKAEGFAASLKK